jgi:hypothetical protein
MNTNSQHHKCILCGASDHHMFDRRQCSEQTDEKIQTNYESLYKKTDDFIYNLTVNADIPDNELHIHILNYVTVLSSVEQYILVRDLKRFIRDIQHGDYDFHPNYFVSLLQNLYLDEILGKRHELFVEHAVEVTQYISSAPSRYNMYERFVEEIQSKEYDTTDIIKCIEYGVNNYFFSKHTESMLMYATDRIKYDCKIDISETGQQIYTWLGRSRDTSP